MSCTTNGWGSARRKSNREGVTSVRRIVCQDGTVAKASLNFLSELPIAAVGTHETRSAAG